MTTTAFRTCPLCEATCGLELQIDGDRITRVRGDADHVLSHGFLCPKGAAYGKLVEDPDRVRRPMVREGETWREVSWPEAFAAVEAGLRGVVERHGSQAVAAYAGNPNVHTLGGGLFLTPLLKALESRAQPDRHGAGVARGRAGRLFGRAVRHHTARVPAGRGDWPVAAAAHAPDDQRGAAGV